MTEDSASNAGANAKFAIVRQVDPSLVMITNDHPSGPELVINGFINNPIGETDITSQHGPITATTIRGGSSSFYGLWGPHSSLIRTNILHLYAGSSIGDSSPCVYGESTCSGSNGSKTLCIDPNNPCVNADLVVWADHPQVVTTYSGTNTFIDFRTLLRDSTLNDPAVSLMVPLIDIMSMLALDSLYVLLYATLYQSVTTAVPGIKVINTAGSGRTATTSPSTTRRTNAGSYQYYPASTILLAAMLVARSGSARTPNSRARGVRKDDPSDHPVESTYNFKILDAGTVGRKG